MDKHAITRRTLLKTGAVLAGALALGDFELQAKVPRAPERSTLVVLWLNGGPAGLFNSADAFLGNGAFGVTPNNIRALGNGLSVDAGSFGALPAVALAHMASVHFRHGLYSHSDARQAVLQAGSRSQLLRMAAAMAPSRVPCAIVNSLGLPVGVTATPSTESGIGFEHIVKFDDARRSLPAAERDAILSVYGVPGRNVAIDSERATFAAVETLVREGAGVVFAQPAYNGRQDRQFDTHHDDAGTLAREIMAPLIPSLGAFLSRVLAFPDRNVVTLLMGEFSRTIPGADHAQGGTATVIGKYVRTGATGRQRPDGSPPEDAPPPEALWAYVAAALGVGEAVPFGANPHAGLLKLPNPMAVG